LLTPWTAATMVEAIQASIGSTEGKPWSATRHRR